MKPIDADEFTKRKQFNKINNPEDQVEDESSKKGNNDKYWLHPEYYFPFSTETN